MAHNSTRELKICARLLSPATNRRGAGSNRVRAPVSGAHAEMTLFTLHNTHPPYAVTQRHTRTQWTKDRRATHSRRARTSSSSRRSLFASFQAAFGGKNNFTIVHKSPLVLSCCIFTRPFLYLWILRALSVVVISCPVLLFCTVRKLRGCLGLTLPLGGAFCTDLILIWHIYTQSNVGEISNR